LFSSEESETGISGSSRFLRSDHREKLVVRTDLLPDPLPERLASELVGGDEPRAKRDLLRAGDGEVDRMCPGFQIDQHPRIHTIRTPLAVMVLHWYGFAVHQGRRLFEVAAPRQDHHLQLPAHGAGRNDDVTSDPQSTLFGRR